MIKKNKLREFLQSPYPAFCQRWKMVVIPSAIIFLVIYLLQPFGISQFESDYKLFILLGYGVVTAIALSISVYLIPAFFPMYYRDLKWTLGKHLISTLMSCFLITICIWLYTSWVYHLILNWQLFWICLIWVALLSPFPIVIFMMWNRNLQLAFHLKEATEMNYYLSMKVLSEEKAASLNGDEIYSGFLTFCGSSKEILEIEVDSFFYAEAEGNYVKITGRLNKDGKVGQKLLRATMKQVEGAIIDAPFIIRCHRAYLVNIRKVIKVDGNSQGYRLRLDGCEEEVPVSRAYAKEVKMHIENMKGR